MFIAAKFGDPVLGIDLHMVMVPTPAGPVPTPLPHPFIGVVFDPTGAAIGAGISAVFGGGGLVLINSLPAGNTGTEVKGQPHLPTPPGVSFAPNDVPDFKGTIVTGSKTVSFAGSSAGRLTSLVSSCGFPLNLPTSVCMSIPMGAPVLVGGPTSMDYMAAVTRGIRTKWFSNLLHNLLKPGKRLSWLICQLTGHPVDVVSGEVLTQSVDFELPGPIPLAFERSYYSRDRADGPLGPGWHHPLNASVQEDDDGRIKVRLPDGRESPHEPLSIGQSQWDAIDRYTLSRSQHGYKLVFWDGQTLHFEPVKGARVSHALVKITDRCDNVIALRYRKGHLAEVTDSIGRDLRFMTSGGRLTAIQLQRRDGEWMDLVRYGYDAERRLATAFDPNGEPFRYAYRGGVLVMETNRNGLSFHFEYDDYEPDGWCVRTWGDGGIYDRRITYDKHRHLTVVDDGRGGRTTYYGNSGGLVDREIDPTGRETRYEWDQACRKVAEIDGLGHRTEWGYDARGNTISARDALGNETRWQYADLNVPIERTDAAGNVWTRSYDARGMLVEATSPLGDATLLQHDRRGNLASVEDPTGRRLALRYTETGELAEVADFEGHATRYTLDERGQVIGQIDALGGETAIMRDARGRPTALRRPDGSMLRIAYDPEGNVTERTDALGNVTGYRYGGFNKVVEQIDPAGGSVRYTYDTEEAIVGVTNQLGEEYRFELDLAGRVVKERGFDGRTLEFLHDRAGRCIETANGQRKRTKIERDALGRVVKQTVPQKPRMGDPIPKGEVYEYAYDALGGLVRAANGACAISFTRDALGRVLEERADGRVIASRYDRAGNRVGRQTSLGHEASYGFDGNGGLLDVTFGPDPRWKDFSPEALEVGGPVRAPWKATFARDAFGSEAERKLPGGVLSRWDRDRVGRPQTHRVSREGEQVSAVGYRFRSYEQIAGLIDTQAGPTWFEHDARSYLVAATRPDGSVQHRASDAVGNIYRSTDRSDRAYGKGGVLREANGVQFLHDDDGQLVAKVLPDGRRWDYSWDHAGQLQEVTRPDGQKVAFAYDALGRRVRKTFGERTTSYVWDGDELVHEVNASAAPTTWVFEPGTFAPLAKVDGDKRYAVVADHLGTPTALLDEAGKLAWKAQLDVYGVARAEAMETSCPWRWPGQYEDDETGLYYNRFRYYDPETGRYVSQDPLRLDGSVELYSYVPDPCVWVDPFGLTKERGLWLLTEALSNAKRTIQGNTYWRHISTGYWWSRDFAGHGGSAFKVFEEGAGGELQWYRDATKFGDFINPDKKHKGPTGKRVCG